uniref:Uncharacterized protein n=1 Tax=Knipowitschia caucasica TaxID=637954 RepID=A0AAV2KS42_KNICA
MRGAREDGHRGGLSDSACICGACVFGACICSRCRSGAGPGGRVSESPKPDTEWRKDLAASPVSPASLRRLLSLKLATRYFCFRPKNFWSDKKSQLQISLQ